MNIFNLLCEKFKPTIRNSIYIHSGSQLQKLSKNLSVLNHNSYVSVHFLKVALFLNQRTPLHVAASKGHDYTVECLVNERADISIKDNAGVSMTILLNYGRWS